MNALQSLTYVYLFLFSSALVAAQQELAVDVKQCVGDTDTFKIDYLTIVCDDYCTWGSNGTYYGTYTLGDNVTTQTPVITNKMWGVTQFSEAVDICVGADGDNVENENGDVCPDAGTYDYETEASLPGSPSSWYSFFGSWIRVTVYSTIDFGDAVVDCQISIKGMSSGQASSNSESFMYTSWSAMMVLGVAAFRMRRRRVIVTEDTDNDGPENVSAVRFIEMTSA